MDQGNQPITDYQSQPPAPSQGKAIASLILGLCSLFLWVCPLIGLAVAIPGVVLGVKGRNEGQGKMATAGMVLSIIGLVLTGLNMVFGAYLGATGQHPVVNRLQGG